LCMFRKDMYKINELAPELYKKGFDVKFTPRSVLIEKGDFESGLGFYSLDDDIISFQSPYHYTGFISRLIRYVFLDGLMKVKYKNLLHNESTKAKVLSKAHGFLHMLPCKKTLIGICYWLLKRSGAFCVKHTIPKEYVLPLRDCVFYNITFKIPNDTNNYLSLFYGKEWKTPDPNFPHKPTLKEYNGFKNTWRKFIVKCPICGTEVVIDNPHKKDDDKGFMIPIEVKCSKCGRYWQEKAFVVGIVAKKIEV